MNSLRQNDVEAQVEIDGLVKWVDRCDSVVVRKKMVNKSIGPGSRPGFTLVDPGRL